MRIAGEAVWAKIRMGSAWNAPRALRSGVTVVIVSEYGTIVVVQVAEPIERGVRLEISGMTVAVSVNPQRLEA